MEIRSNLSILTAKQIYKQRERERDTSNSILYLCMMLMQLLPSLFVAHVVGYFFYLFICFLVICLFLVALLLQGYDSVFFCDFSSSFPLFQVQFRGTRGR